ncbi:hypothetical protein D3C78_1199790 [compost metagenome]
MMPPITAIAIGARNEPPSPTPSAEGNMPADMAMEVMMIGRARLRPASTMACTRSMPCRRISMAKSTSRMAFFVTMPISIRMPMRTGMESAFCVMMSATATPPMASGSENRMVKGWMTSLNSRMSTTSTSIRPSSMAFTKPCCISPCTLASPLSARRTLAGRSVSETMRLNSAVEVSSAVPNGTSEPMETTRLRSLRLIELGPSE